jgi:hypothetical protein
MTEFSEIPQQASSGGLTEILRNITSSIRFPAYGEDPAVFTSPPKVTITRDSDGSAVLEEVEATEVPEVDGDIKHFVVEIPGDKVPEVDLLTVVWSDGSSSYTTFTEVVGGFVTSLRSIEAKLDKVPSEHAIAEMREIALRSIEDACGVAFRRRYARETLDGTGALELVLRKPQLRRLLSASIEGQAQETDALRVDPAGLLIASSRWPEGSANIEVAYAHGYESYPPAGLPVRDLAAYLLTPSPTNWDERATGVSTESGTYSLVVAGVRGAIFPLPSVNAFVEQNRYLSIG